MKNDYEFLSNGTVKIFLTLGQYTTIDLEDFELVSKHRWNAHKRNHSNSGSLKYDAVTNILYGSIYMHRLINNTPKEFVTDHIDDNPLNNRRNNLRAVTTSRNKQNARLRSNNKSGYKGVSWCKRGNKWTARFRLGKKYLFLGRFDSLEEAALAYNKAVTKHRPEYGFLNIIDKEEKV